MIIPSHQVRQIQHGAFGDYAEVIFKRQGVKSIRNSLFRARPLVSMEDQASLAFGLFLDDTWAREDKA